MAIFWRRNQTQVPPPAAQFNQPPRRRWPVIAGSIIAALIIAGLAVLAGLWIYSAVSDNDNGDKKPANVAGNNSNKTPQAPPAGSSGRNGSSQSAGGSARSGSQGSSGGNEATTLPADTGDQTAKNLPNNGPGDVAAIALGVAFVAAGLHYVITLRKQS